MRMAPARETAHNPPQSSNLCPKLSSHSASIAPAGRSAPGLRLRGPRGGMHGAAGAVQPREVKGAGPGAELPGLWKVGRRPQGAGRSGSRRGRCRPRSLPRPAGGGHRPGRPEAGAALLLATRLESPRLLDQAPRGPKPT